MFDSKFGVLTRTLVCLMATASIGCSASFAQDSDGSQQPRVSDSSIGDQSQQSAVAMPTFRNLPRNLLAEEKAFWISPGRLRSKDSLWLVPLGFAVGTMLATDRYVPGQLSLSSSTQKSFGTISNAGLFGFAAASGGAYLLGSWKGDEHLRSSGFIAGEAMIQSLALGEGFKLLAGRERPDEGDHLGKFRRGGSSFPSEHSMLAWSTAAVFAQAYPSKLTKFIAYGGAAAVSASRVLAYKHFPSDALVGSTLGYLIGTKVYRMHQPGSKDDRIFGSFERDINDADSKHIGSPYVPVDNWVYPALDRLSALGYVNSDFKGLRPWTRMEFARLLEEAGEAIESEPEVSVEATLLYAELSREFAIEMGKEPNGSVESANLTFDSAYVRATNIAGKPLTDGFHFSQTLVNDFGRPYQEGFNTVGGTAVRGSAGPLSFYVREEFQRAPGAPALPDNTAHVISAADYGTPLISPVATPATTRGRLLDAYVGLTVFDTEFSFGKQTLNWGPTSMGSFLLSDNAEPMMMFRMNRTKPFTLPWIFRWLGPGRADAFLGQMSGYKFLDPTLSYVITPVRQQPWVEGQKVSFKPTPNLEIGIGHTSVFAGTGVGLTVSSFWSSLASTGNGKGRKDPGDRRASFDLAYKLPGVRNRAQFYMDSFVDDEVNPIPYVRRSAINAGLYFPSLPKLKKLDLRMEGGYTDAPAIPDSGFFYLNIHYRSGYTNNGNLLGNWIGRDGRAVLVSSTWWASPHNNVKVSFRDHRVDPTFALGGRLQDFSVSTNWMLKRDLALGVSTQYERWRFPALALDRNSNFASTIQLTYAPNSRLWSR